MKYTINTTTLLALLDIPSCEEDVRKWRKEINSFDEFCLFLKGFIQRHDGNIKTIRDINLNVNANIKRLERKAEEIVDLTNYMCSIASFNDLDPLIANFPSTGSASDVLATLGKKESADALESGLIESLCKIALTQEKVAI